jgi:hypothetical protein
MREASEFCFGDVYVTASEKEDPVPQFIFRFVREQFLWN